MNMFHRHKWKVTCYWTRTFYGDKNTLIDLYCKSCGQTKRKRLRIVISSDDIQRLSEAKGWKY